MLGGTEQGQRPKTIGQLRKPETRVRRGTRRKLYPRTSSPAGRSGVGGSSSARPSPPDLGVAEQNTGVVHEGEHKQEHRRGRCGAQGGGRRWELQDLEQEKTGSRAKGRKGQGAGWVGVELPGRVWMGKLGGRCWSPEPRPCVRASGLVSGDPDLKSGSVIWTSHRASQNPFL